MRQTMTQAFWNNFLGQSPVWYKQAVLAFLVINPIVYLFISPFIAGWLLIIGFIFTLAMALKCYPLQPGGLLAIEAVILGMTTPYHIKHEIVHNLEVILLLMFMVAGIYFMKNMLLFVFTKILLGIRSKMLLSILFSFVAAVLSAFLDALTVTAVLIAVAVGFYSVYHKAASGAKNNHNHDHTVDDNVHELHRSDLDNFRAFLRSLIMHGAVGTALGGVCTIVGEPQNVVIGAAAGWEFVEFFLRVAPVSMPALVAGLLTCLFLEKIKKFGYGAELPEPVREILIEFDKNESAKRTTAEKTELVVQAAGAILLVFALAFHIAPIGLIGLMIIVLLTAFNGVTDEHRIGHAFEEALPFTALLVVFFAVVAVINDLNLFAPVTNAVMSLSEEQQGPMFFIANGLLSMVSDNVFVATVYISEVKEQYDAGLISKEHFETLAIAINTGTNLPSVATPNGQAAFLFLLTSALAPLIRLSYGRMVLMAIPYTIVLSIVGVIAVTVNL